MKKILWINIVIICTLFFSSCLTSLHPLVTTDKVITDNRIVGTWLADDDTIRINKFPESDLLTRELVLQPFKKMEYNPDNSSKNDSIIFANGYEVTFRKDNVQYHMFGALTKIGNNLFCDLIPVIANDAKNEAGNGFEFTNDYLTTFSMAKIELNGNSRLTIRFLNGDFIKELIRNGQVRIKHEKDELFETFLVTASSEELRQFLAKYGHDERLFSKENSITLTRKG